MNCLPFFSQIRFSSESARLCQTRVQQVWPWLNTALVHLFQSLTDAFWDVVCAMQIIFTHPNFHSRYLRQITQETTIHDEFETLIMQLRKQLYSKNKMYKCRYMIPTIQDLPIFFHIYVVGKMEQFSQNFHILFLISLILYRKKLGAAAEEIMELKVFSVYQKHSLYSINF